MRLMVVICPEFVGLNGSSALFEAFEPVVSCIEELTPRIEILEAGVCAVPTKGPSRYFGGDAALKKHVDMLVCETLRHLGRKEEVLIGIADGMFAARLAANDSQVVPSDATVEFLAKQSIDVLDQPNLVDLLKRLGVQSLGALASLPRVDVVDRFGKVGESAHCLASGLPETNFVPRVKPLDLAVTHTCEEPIETLDLAGFAAKTLADKLQESLSEEGLACSRLVIEAHLTNGEVASRVWRHDGRLTAVAIAERLRWQVEAALLRRTHPAFGGRPSGISSLVLIPEGLVLDNGRQLGFWGTDLDADMRASRGLVRVQGLVGEAGVVTAVVAGGRTLRDRIQYKPWGEAAVVDRPRDLPWPGALPTPFPATVFAEPKEIALRDSDGELVSVDARGMISAAPDVLQLQNKSHCITAWAGPWLIEEQWWRPKDAKRRACVQLLTDANIAYLAVLEKRKWWLEARYD